MAMMRSSPARIAEMLDALRAVFGAGDFRPIDAVRQPRLLPLIHKLLGRRGQVVKRLGHWLREHKDSTAGELRLSGEYMTHKRRWIWCIEAPGDGPSAEEMADSIAEAAERFRAQIESKPTALAQVEAWERVTVKLQKNAQDIEKRAEEAAIKEENRRIRHEAAKARRAAQRAAEQWAIEIKARTRTIAAVIAAIKEPYSPQLIDGSYYVLCSKERAGELAAKLHQIVRAIPHAYAMARAVRIGEAAADRQRRHEDTKRARRDARRNQTSSGPTFESCATERLVLAAAIGIDARPGAPGIGGKPCWQLMPRRDWWNV